MVKAHTYSSNCVNCYKYAQITEGRKENWSESNSIEYSDAIVQNHYKRTFFWINKKRALA